MAFFSVLTLLGLATCSSAGRSNLQTTMYNCATLDPCKNGACVGQQSTLSAYTCECFLGWAGVDCEVPALISPVFSSNMVLQRFQPADVSTGRAAISPVIFGADNSTLPGDSITLTLSPMVGGVGGPLTAVANVNGSWSITLPPLNVSTTPIAIHVTSSQTSNETTLKNILVGDVYVCSGQSNMALAVESGYLPSTAAAVEMQAASRLIRLLNNGHFWPPTPSRPGETALGAQTGDAPGWAMPTTGNGSSASPGTVANFSAVCYFMGVHIHDALDGKVPIGLISTAAGGTNINRWSSPNAIAKCSQVTPFSNTTEYNIGTLFEPMVLPLAPMAVRGFTWFQGEANECGNYAPKPGTNSPCGGKYYACQLRAMINNWRKTFKQLAVPFLVNELGALQDKNWPVLRHAFHEACSSLNHTAVISNTDLGDDNGRVDHGLPDGAMHSKRKIELGRRNALAMLSLVFPSQFATTVASGPLMQTVTIETSDIEETQEQQQHQQQQQQHQQKQQQQHQQHQQHQQQQQQQKQKQKRAQTQTQTQTQTQKQKPTQKQTQTQTQTQQQQQKRKQTQTQKQKQTQTQTQTQKSRDVVEGSRLSSTQITIGFSPETSKGLHFAGAADCIVCCNTSSMENSPIMLRVENKSDVTGFTWQRTSLPQVGSNGLTVTATFTPTPSDAVFSTTLLRFTYEGEPECILYNGVGGPDNHTSIAAAPFYVDISTGTPIAVPSEPCYRMVNGKCYLPPAPPLPFVEKLHAWDAALYM